MPDVIGAVFDESDQVDILSCPTSRRDHRSAAIRKYIPRLLRHQKPRWTHDHTIGLRAAAAVAGKTDTVTDFAIAWDVAMNAVAPSKLNKLPEQGARGQETVTDPSAVATEELSKGTLQTDCCTGLMPGAVSLAEEKDHDIERRSGTTNMGSSRDLFSMGFDLEQLLEDTDFTLPLITMPVPRKRHTPRRGLSTVIEEDA